MELQAQLAAEKDKKSNARQQAREAGEEVKKAQVSTVLFFKRARAVCSHVSSLFKTNKLQ